MFSKFDYAQVINPDSNARVDIMGDGKIWSGILIQHVQMSGMAHFGEVGSGENLDSVNSAVEKFIRGTNIIAGSIFGTAITSRQVRSIAGTTLSWVGSGHLELALTLLCMNFKKGDDFVRDWKEFYKYQYPSGDTVALGDLGITVLKAPGGYTPGTTKAVSGTLSLKIGKWFRSDKVFVAPSFMPVFSTETTKNGKPLYAQVQVRLQSFKLMTEKEVIACFVG